MQITSDNIPQIIESPDIPHIIEFPFGLIYYLETNLGKNWRDLGRIRENT